MSAASIWNRWPEGAWLRHQRGFSIRDLDPIAALPAVVVLSVQAAIGGKGEVVHKHDFLPEQLTPEIRQGYYATGNYHRVCLGQILNVQAMPDAASRLG